MKTVQISDYTSTCWLCGSPARICEKVERDTGLSLVAYCTPAHAPMRRWWKEQDLSLDWEYANRDPEVTREHTGAA